MKFAEEAEDTSDIIGGMFFMVSIYFILSMYF